MTEKLVPRANMVGTYLINEDPVIKKSARGVRIF